MSAKNNDAATNPATAASAAAELELKRRGRRRLIGAITLGLIAIVVLPMIFDSAPRKVETGKQEIAISIPPKDGLPPLAPPASPPPGPASTAPAAAAPAAAAPSTSPPAGPAVAPAPASTATTNPTPAVLPPSPAELASVKTAKPEPKAEPKTATKSEAKPDSQPAAAAAPLAAKAEGGFVVQIGAYKEAANAKEVVARMKAAKLPVVTDTVAVKSGSVTRVRVGPYADRAAAESALAAVKLAGEDGKVVPVK